MENKDFPRRYMNLRRLCSVDILAVIVIIYSFNPVFAAETVGAGTEYAVSSAAEKGFVNLRADPNPASPSLAQLKVGAAVLRATGKSQLYGDTWWYEVDAEGAHGWVNSRFIYRAGTPDLAAIVTTNTKIERKFNQFFEGEGYFKVTKNSFEECERLCLADTKCTAIEFYRPTKYCSLYKRIPASATANNADVGIKQPLIITGSITRQEAPSPPPR